MTELFSDLPEAINNTVKIATQCNVEMVSDQVLLPRFECPDNLSAEDYLKQLVWHFRFKNVKKYQHLVLILNLIIFSLRKAL